ncbi:hypothetical protein [Streptomyces sp. NRRL F-5755]|uniref:hypothetical protein n=1 Tax=Streptomyces sp. NRRL F-5755 TaxID=1519475 RepID=UPI0006ADABB5|nr:hypothetical protein [Streptomyces sp. NRRL F-5755]
MKRKPQGPGKQADGTEDWFTGPAWRDRDGRGARRRKRIRIGAAVIVAAGAAVLVLNPGDIRSKLPGRLGGDTTAAAPLPPETAAPGAAPADEAFPATPTLAAPFAGSPAVRYADGAAGIVLPDARPVGRLSKDEVADVLRKVRELLTDANLNPRTLRGERPTAALDLIDPFQTDVREDVAKGLAKPDRDHDPLRLFTRFDPHEVRLVGDVVKTRGRITFKEGRDGALAVHTDHTFVYPVVRAAPGASEVTRTVVRRVVDVEINDPARFRVTPGKLALTGYDSDFGNNACAVYDGFLHPQFPDSRAAAEASGPATDPYDRSKELRDEKAGACGTVSRI